MYVVPAATTFEDIAGKLCISICHRLANVLHIIAVKIAYDVHHISGLVQECSIPVALSIEILWSRMKPSISPSNSCHAGHME